MWTGFSNSIHLCLSAWVCNATLHRAYAKAVRARKHHRDDLIQQWQALFFPIMASAPACRVIDTMTTFQEQPQTFVNWARAEGGAVE